MPSTSLRRCRDDFLTDLCFLVLTSSSCGTYKAFIDGGAANELAAGAVMFLLLECLVVIRLGRRGVECCRVLRLRGC